MLVLAVLILLGEETGVPGENPRRWSEGRPLQTHFSSHNQTPKWGANREENKVLEFTKQLQRPLDIFTWVKN